MRKTLEHEKKVDNKLTVTAETLADMLDCGRAAAVKVGTDAGARLKIGRRVLFKVSKVNEYLEALADKSTRK